MPCRDIDREFVNKSDVHIGVWLHCAEKQVSEQRYCVAKYCLTFLKFLKLILTWNFYLFLYVGDLDSISFKNMKN
jgi:hypothetical protein